MRDGFIVANLSRRGALLLKGTDARSWLDNLITNDIASTPFATFAALLSPQGKILFEFFVVPIEGGFLIDAPRDHLEALKKRLLLYKLRADISLEVFDILRVYAKSSDVYCPASTILAANEDPRDPDLGLRIYAIEPITQTHRDVDYDRARVQRGVPEAGSDYALGTTFPHEANFDLLNGLSFTKGCFIGQEVAARMQNKTVVRKRIVRIAGPDLISGAEIKAGKAPLGTIGTVAGNTALAMVRLDRAIEALDSGIPILAGPHTITIDAEALTAYRHAVATRPPEPDL